ncbi:hypothetical protein BOTBODRAFT_116731 [Botryobasidium botryosum FD-172 SS1]|uniref:Aspartic peptidase DDI1-type domain-containing protein n=1 Tax=Botryobasidium botryosum (strain FD-172 SS1) TaxID=930990 RepID=A0A067MDU0_BOTB1|nr:hypothetical protein BOTBODRAFT_116731 [Botryobasidium botryosum FD-172 SS1]
MSVDDLRSHIGERIIGAASLPLRSIDGVVEGRTVVECVLDQGVMIVVMRKDIWERSGLPLRHDMVLTMENANNSTNRTMGFLPRVRVSFGGMELLLRVQVVDNAPFEILLGRPFFSLTSCETKDFRTGEQHVMLTSPDTGESLRFATREKGRRRRESVEEEADF